MITFYVDGVAIETEQDRLSLREIMRLAGRDGVRLSNPQTGTTWIGNHHQIFVRDGLRLVTGNAETPSK